MELRLKFAVACTSLPVKCQLDLSLFPSSFFLHWRENIRPTRSGGEISKNLIGAVLSLSLSLSLPLTPLSFAKQTREGDSITGPVFAVKGLTFLL